jgi:hypothetical protein
VGNEGSGIAGIIDTIEKPCCCKLLVDLEWITLKNVLVGQTPTLPTFKSGGHGCEVSGLTGPHTEGLLTAPCLRTRGRSLYGSGEVRRLTGRASTKRCRCITIGCSMIEQ